MITKAMVIEEDLAQLARELDSAQRTWWYSISISLIKCAGKFSELFPLIDIESDNWSILWSKSLDSR